MHAISILGTLDPGVEIRPASKPRVWGYDALRFVAIACVAVRHLSHISDRDAGLLGFHPGLAVFAGLSGFLALTAKGHPLGWLWKRLRRIYPAYWLCLSAMYALNYVVQYKPAFPCLVSCQYLGIAHLTHPGQLVGVHTWFITLIVSCYLMAACLRRERRLLPIAALAVLCLHYGQGDQMWGYCLTFVAGASVAAAPTVRGGAVAVAAASLAVAIAFDPLFFLPFWGAAALLVGSFFSGKAPRSLNMASRCTYEFYLTHGPVYLGLSRVLGLSFLPNLIIGTPIAILSALALQRATQAILTARDAKRRAAFGRAFH